MDTSTLEANRRGELTEAQRARFAGIFRRVHLLLLVYGGALAFVGYLMRAQLASAWPFLAGLSIFLVLVYYFVAYRLAAKGMADLAEGRLDTATGTRRVWRDYRAGGARIHIDGKVLRLTSTNAAGWKMLRSAAPMSFHYLPRSLYVVSFETGHRA